ncbi:S-(hydroxymethyl)mycothiol dehydrogenase [Ruegeria sp. THAF57]|uniref:NADPH-dependent aldehyde reductase Ahr n=1 Tax=Ruegeria sp. THAF57 TaxID=2744555 RepID=UPI0015DEA357|nr:NAD(P)-dependent alcohol dehydrogenase [Ruegeria sp. THAF57]CAD0187222.1 S-(hydroxymethyl)mycothiol dehydrogenase [Ruegeria sp. THAF57]
MIQAYAVHEPGGEFQPFEYDPGPLAAGDVEIDVEYCGICHSDLSMANNEWGATAYPFVPGHEVAGHIAAVGAGVTGLKPGDRVGLGWQAAFCNECHECKSGDHNMCADVNGTLFGRHGGFADKVRAQAEAVVKLPEDLGADVAGPLFCGGVTVYNPLKQFDIKPTDRVGVIGIGGLGHMALQFLNAWGCEVTAFTSSEAKKQEALELGAHHTLDTHDSDALADAARSFDLILSTVNVPLDWAGYLNTLKPRGRLHLVGAVTEPINLSVFSLMGKQASISSSPVGSPATIAEMLDFAARHDIAPKVEMFDIKDVNAAMDRLANGSPRYRVVLKVK